MLRLIHTGETISRWRGKEATSLQPAMHQPGIAEHRLARIGIGNQFGLRRNLQEPPEHGFRMDHMIERGPAAQIEGMAERERRARPIHRIAKVRRSRQTAEQITPPAFRERQGPDFAGLEVGLAEYWTRQAMPQPVRRTAGGKFVGP